MDKLIQRFEFASFRKPGFDEKNVINTINRLKKLYPYPTLEFWMEGYHEHSTDHGDVRKVAGRVLCWDKRTHFLVQDNPWQELADSYSYYGTIDEDEEGFYEELLVPEEVARNVNTRDRSCLWVRYNEVKYLEIRYAPTSNKEAALSLTRLEEL